MADQDVAHDRHETGSSPRNNDAPTPIADAAGNGQASSVESHHTESGPRDELTRRVNDLWARYTSAVAAMNRAADAMREDGLPPGYQLVHTLGECHRGFLRLRLDVIRCAGSVGVPIPPPGELVAIRDLVRLIQSCPVGAPPTVDQPPSAGSVETAYAAPPLLPADVVEVAPPENPLAFATCDTAPAGPAFEPLLTAREHGEEEEKPAGQGVEQVRSEDNADGSDRGGSAVAEEPGEALRSGALAVLDSCLRLTVRDGSDFPPLAECREKARALKDALATGPPADVERIGTATHAFSALLSVVTGIEGLTDAQWAELHSSVSETFGRQLAVAAARGRLSVAAEPDGSHA